MAGRARVIGLAAATLASWVVAGCDDGDPSSAVPTVAPAGSTGETAGSGPSSAPTSAPAAGPTSPDPSPGVSASTPAPGSGPSSGSRCVVYLHGKGGTGGETVTEDGVRILAPTGNAEGWGGRQWLYFPEEEYEAARDVVAEAVDGCGPIIVGGFSNGASFAAALYCRGETFDGRLVRVVVDDPVTDHAVDDCAPDPATAVTLYWTGALEGTATPGWQCADGDWTCQGGETIGIEAYADALGAEPQESPFDEHQWYVDAPELSDWS